MRKKILSVKGAKKAYHSATHMEKYAAPLQKQQRHATTQLIWAARLSSTHPPPLTIHTSHTCYDDGDDTHNSAITHQALIKISHSPSKRLPGDFVLLFLFLIENENRVFSFEVGKVNVTLRIKRS